MDSFINDFLVEAKELIQNSMDGILFLEKNPGNTDEINKIFRAVHTMKSSSGLVGLDIFVGFLHAAEDALDDVRKNKIEFTQDLATLLLNMLDKLNEWIALIEMGEELQQDAFELANKMAIEFRNMNKVKVVSKPEKIETKPNADTYPTVVPKKQAAAISLEPPPIELGGYDQQIAQKQENIKSKSKKNGIKTLVVEDDFITGQVMQEILSDFGECQIAENGLIAVEFFTRAMKSGRRFDVIYLDIMMPEISGQEVLSLFRAIERGCDITGLDCVKVVMSTALGDYENVRQAFEHQCEGYVVKPISKDKIVKSLQDLKMVK